MTNFDIENFDEVKLKGEELYKSLEPTYCPYFKERIHFNTEALEHLKFKRRNVARPRQDQYMRFKLLKVIVQILNDSRTVQGIWETKEFQKVRKHSRTELILQSITYYEFIAVVENVRVKIIIKKTEGGPYLFWSIIPFWGVSKDGGKRRLYSGNLGED